MKLYGKGLNRNKSKQKLGGDVGVGLDTLSEEPAATSQKEHCSGIPKELEDVVDLEQHGEGSWRRT